MILDAGFRISVDRSEEAARQFLAAADRRGIELRTTHPVVGQVWRDGGRQAGLASFLKGGRSRRSYDIDWICWAQRWTVARSCS